MDFIDRRRQKRFPAQLKTRWHNIGTGLMTSIGLGGGFIETSEEPPYNIEFLIEIEFPQQLWVKLPAKIIYNLSSRGFGISFSNLTEEQTHTLEEILKYIQLKMEASLVQ
jgi:hypothetical protein